MKFIYPAIISKTADDRYAVRFPDLDHCYAQGDTVEEAVEQANEAAYDWISLELSEDSGQLPPVSDPADMQLQPGDIVRNICVNFRFSEGYDE